jgi:hypothetical protein
MHPGVVVRASCIVSVQTMAKQQPVGCNLIRLFPNLLAGTLSRQGLFDPALRARLQVKGVALHFLDDVFRLIFALEATEGTIY